MVHVDPTRASALCSAYRDVLARVTRLKPKRPVESPNREYEPD